MSSKRCYGVAQEQGSPSHGSAHESAHESDDSMDVDTGAAGSQREEAEYSESASPRPETPGSPEDPDYEEEPDMEEMQRATDAVQTDRNGGGAFLPRMSRSAVDADEESEVEGPVLSGTDATHQGGRGQGAARGGAAGPSSMPFGKVDCSVMRDFVEEHFGGGKVDSRPPIFAQGASANSTWVEFSELNPEAQNFVPSRVLCYQFPRELFDSDGSRFRNMVTPLVNPQRAIDMCAVLGLNFAGTSKGWLSGTHEELQRANGDDDSGEDKDDEVKKKLKRVYRYTYMLAENNNVSAPMFVIGYQELWNEALDEVTAVRVYKFIFDDEHSDSELVRNVMDESRDTKFASGIAHSQNHSRRRNLVDEHRQHKVMTGKTSLEDHAGIQYFRISSESQLLNALKNAAGKSIRGPGKPTCDWKALPPGVISSRITKSTDRRGGQHPLSPEYQHNAKRQAAFNAWLVDFEGGDCDVHPNFLDSSLHFTDRGEFTLPKEAIDMKAMWLCIDPSVTNVFDLPLPRPMYTKVNAGRPLLRMYKEVCIDGAGQGAPGQGAPGERDMANLLDRFNNFMTGTDSEHIETEKQAREAVCSYDSTTLSDAERENLRHYGEMDHKNAYVIEPRQKLKEIQYQTRHVVAKVVDVWVTQRRKLRDDEFERCQAAATTSGAQSMDLEKTPPGGGSESDAESDDEGTEAHVQWRRGHMRSVRRIAEETQARHCQVMRDVIHLHLNRIQAAFESTADRATVPEGYHAMYDYLKATSTSMGTASVAWHFDNNLVGDDTSAFAQMMLTIGCFFENDCFIEGRDWRIMFEIFFHLFEQYGDITFVLLLCGTKGNGKSLRTKRAMQVYPPGWATEAGPGSNKSGMNGGMDNNNGKNLIYDEMNNEITEKDGSERLEYWKQIVLNREYTYNRTVAVKNADGTETHRTMKLKTPHAETHVICTNYGMAFTKDGSPTDTKFAMIDRSIAHVVRSLGTNAHDDAEFNRHMSSSETQKKLTKFRLFVSLVGATKLATMGVPAFQPNLAYANKVFDFLDKDLVVGEYNLPFRSPRKCLKRDENLRTMACMSAVCNVFMYKQTAIDWEAGRLDADGKPRLFQWTMLYDVIRQLHVTPEQIFMAWSQSLDYNIGTALHSFAMMTAICESFKIRVGDWLQKPPSDQRFDEVRMQGDLRDPSCVDNVLRPQGEGESDEDYQRYTETFRRVQDMRQQNEFKESVFMPYLTTDGISRAERLEMLVGLERQRKATSLYRQQCSKGGNSQILFDNPVGAIDKIMKSAPLPPDAVEDAGREQEAMPLYPSCIIASAANITSLYDPQALVQWCTNGLALCSEVGPAIEVGTRPSINFKQTPQKGANRWDTAWLRQEYASRSLESSVEKVGQTNHTMKRFDFSTNIARDGTYFLTVKDNARRITEEPDVSYGMRKSRAFVNMDGKEVTENSNFLKMRGVTDTRGSDVPYSESPQRHPYSKVSGVVMQRRLDFAVTHGRLPAVMPLISNKTSNEAPVRFVEDRKSEKGDRFLELNTAAAFDHTRCMAEAVLRCSVQPGLEGKQEVFCDNLQGPDGLVATTNVSGQEKTVMWPYSYDLGHIAMTLDAMGRYYDPVGRGILQQYNEAYEDLGMKVTFEELPHLSTRFVGYDEDNRLLVSVKMPEKRSPSHAPVDASDKFETADVNSTTRNLVSLSIGHDASDDEVESHLRAKAGSRNMSGVQGELFSMETYLKHSVVGLKERGMISHDHDAPAGMIYDEMYGLRIRTYELASKKINEIIEKSKRMKKAMKARPGDESLSADRLRDVEASRNAAAHTEISKDIKLPANLEHFRFTACLKTKNPRSVKLTYDNNEKRNAEMERERRRQREKAKRTSGSLSDASSVSDISKMQRSMLPGGARTFRQRGLEDTRNRDLVV